MPAVHREGDSTGGHGSWVPNASSEGSPNVFANGIPVTRVSDRHVGHASPTPGPFHRTAYNSGSPNVFVNSEEVIKVGDTTSCGDPATAGSPDIFVN